MKKKFRENRLKVRPLIQIGKKFLRSVIFIAKLQLKEN